MILLLISFIAGVLTILAPCTLPLLPVIVGSSVSRKNEDGTTSDISRVASGRLKAFRIALSLAVSVILFTLLLKFSTALIQIPAYVWTLISGSIIILFGLTSIFPTLWEKVPGVASLNVSSNRLLGVGYKKKGILGDIIIGASLGPVFSTCSPTYFIILATVLPQSFFQGLICLIAYAVGLGGMIMLISIVGQKLVDRLGGISDTRGTFKKVIGIIFVILGVLILTGVDKIAERKLLDSGIFDITKIERSLLELNDKHKVDMGDLVKSIEPKICEGSEGRCKGENKSEDIDTNATGRGSTTNGAGAQDNSQEAKTEARRSTGLPQAPDFVNPSGFINTNGKKISMADYRGKKVILLDVWTYSCINCQRTLPYINAWYEKYKDQGLEIIGLHTPEFAFEKVQSNVEREVQKFGIKYPVVMDNEYGTWNAYGNRYWPRKYLINEYGEIIYDHIGEGDYEETEMQIQKALAGANSATKKQTSDTIGAKNITDPENKIEVDPSRVKSPEVYFGFNRNILLANGKVATPGDQTLSVSSNWPEEIESNKLYLSGSWDFESEFARTKSIVSGDSVDVTKQPKIIFKYNAKNVYMVLSGVVNGNGPSATASLGVYVDGVKTKTIKVNEQQLYTIVEGTDYGVHTLEVRVESGELNAYTFTFG